ncbi:unnamed protein product [Blumeria hordei]|uniref:tRNA (adenine(58)-N(1))-methyltransferase catalytic subunit TRM61 n=1 Tax=Blumeria hordei TaxID=2867405 RepID=A0A383UNK7_BLUHO|nr:unnamed protein product [Blumeria hordei]
MGSSMTRTRFVWRLGSFSGPLLPISYRQFCSRDIVQENDIVALKSTANATAEIILTRPLQPGNTVSYKKLKNIIRHESLIGKHIRQVVRARNGNQYTIFRPTLGEYTDNSPRLVTPIYSQDANLIVSLLDLHPTVPGIPSERLEIFEAGTGHGALTLCLARAVHAANSAPPEIPAGISANTAQEPVNESYETWRSQRRAIIHSLDIDEKRSRHAAANIKKFRNGMYFPNIDFHVGSIADIMNEKLTLNQSTPFLQHAILDLPSPELHMEIVSRALKENGLLLVFVPSITQITKISSSSKKGFSLVLENVLEIGGMIGTGGREWDVRPVQPKASFRLAISSAEPNILVPSSSEDLIDHCVNQVPDSVEIEDLAESTVSSDPEETKKSSQVSQPENSENGWEIVCRPRVGVRVTNGGFVGIWRKVGHTH